MATNHLCTVALLLCLLANGALCLDLLAGVAGSVTGSLTLKANTETTINFVGGTKLVITGTADATVKVTETTKVAIALPEGFKSFAVGAYSGLTIDVDVGTITKASLTTSAADVTAALSIVAGMQAACLRFDADAKAYTFIDGAKYNSDKTMTVDLPSAGFYAFVSASLTVPIPTIYAQARTTNSSSSTTIVYGGGELNLDVQTTTDNSITCTKKKKSDAAAPANKASINIYFDIELKTKEEKVKKGEIKYKYDSAAVKASGASEASLRFMFKNEAGVWTALSDNSSSVDVSAKVVIATTTHFSEWGVFGSSTENSTGEGSTTVGTSTDSSTSSLTGSLRVVASLLAMCFMIISS
mmetsp:Transcript_89338/g.130691  ORF Transcript_89338/g.130691 Transcript_89338/m.130691 type:complete len:355 (-) Transcript_89338:320-1384(-)